MYLKSWWSKTYNRPLKDSLLESYTLHELLYEYHDKVKREQAIERSFELEADKIEEEQENEVLDWVEEEERKEREALAAKKEDPAVEDEEWMLKQLKEEYGEDFGGDIDQDFSG